MNWRVSIDRVPLLMYKVFNNLVLY
jgi:hypothetical protein